MTPQDTPPVSNPRAWQPPTPEELQAQLSGYRVDQFLARGGMGAVYRGTHLSLERTVAIKILPPHLREIDPTFAQRFKQEARAMAQLNHPAIVGVYSSGEMADGTLYFIMEFIDGTDVGQMVAQQGRLSSAHAMSITAHVCDALQYAHTHGVVHRDIKPANIMVGYDGRVKVADFGLAKSSNVSQANLTVSGHVMGTPHFLAPEALMLGSSVDHRADIYAVGVMLYQMLTGKLPKGIFEMPSMLVAGLDPRYDPIIAKAMREDRSARYQAILEMRRALDGMITQPVQQTLSPSTPATAPEKPTAKPNSRRDQKQPAVGRTGQKSSFSLWVLATAAIAIIGFIVWMEVMAPPPDPVLTASKEKPFTNSLGMKFVPVPETNVLMCIHETRYQDWKAYATPESGVNPRWKNYQAFLGYELKERADEHPVKNVTHDDAVDFCQWLSQKEGRTYRLPTDKEWSQAIGIAEKEEWSEGSTPENRSAELREVFPWGTAWSPPPGAGNFADTDWNKTFPKENRWIEGYTDGFPATAPVMSFKPNPLGIHDLSGNVAEWVADWWNEDQTDRTFRGPMFYTSEPDEAASTARGHLPPRTHYNNANHGFRCVLAKTTPPTVTSTTSKSAQTSVADPLKQETREPQSTTPIDMSLVYNEEIDHLRVNPEGTVKFGKPERAFIFSTPAKGFQTENRWGRENAESVHLQMNIAQPRRIYAVLTGSAAGDPSHHGQQVGVIIMSFADGSHFQAEIKAGITLRAETWGYDDEPSPVIPITDGPVSWSNVLAETQNRGRPAKAFLDMLEIRLPPEKAATTLTGITIKDTSRETLNTFEPGFCIYALSVGHG